MAIIETRRLSHDVLPFGYLFGNGYVGGCIIGFDVIAFTANHGLDYGYEPLFDTIMNFENVHLVNLLVLSRFVRR